MMGLLSPPRTFDRVEVDIHHLAAVGAGRRARKPRHDSELIRLCKRAKRLFDREREANRRLCDADDAGEPLDRTVRAACGAVRRLKEALAIIAAAEANTPEGLAFKAAMLAPWVSAGFSLVDEDGPGQDLALSIAKVARRIGTDSALDARHDRGRG